MNQDLRIIKKEYGEKMMHFCRENFASILETPGLLSQIFLDHFAPNKELIDDIYYYKDKFVRLIYNFIKPNEEIECLNSDMHPKELFAMAGYDFYECHSEEDIQSFKKYYAKGEELCTFHGGRLQKCYVFFVVKKDVNNIKREDFSTPQREDEYGTSVMSIQFTRDASHVLSIKNRYNHTVYNPDATYSNNLNRIFPGLEESFSKHYGLKQAFYNSEFELNHYVWDSKGKYHKYLYERDNIYYCANNVVLDNYEEIIFSKDRYLVMESYILDMHEKKIYNYSKKSHDAFPASIKGIKKISVEKNKANNHRTIHIFQKSGEEALININEYNEIISYSNKEPKYIGNNFLKNNTKIKSLELPNVKVVGNSFLEDNITLKHFDMPNLYIVGDGFLRYNNRLEEVSFPKLIVVGRCFMASSKIKRIYIPSLKKVDFMFLSGNRDIENLDVPNLIYAGGDFLESNHSLTNVNLRRLTFAEDGFLRFNTSLENIDLPHLRIAEQNFLSSNKNIKASYPKILLTDRNFINDEKKKGRLFFLIYLFKIYCYPSINASMYLNACATIARDDIKKLQRKAN